MSAIEIFSSSIYYKYKARICSLSSLIVLLFVIMSIITPLFLMFNAGGFWIKTKINSEMPDISFQYKYLLLMERGIEMAPIVCSTFTSYKENKISDDCLIIKVQEIDTNNDGKKDIFKFEAQFYTDSPIKNIKLFLFFDFKLKQLFESSIQSFAIFDHTLNQDEQKIHFIADLELKQRSILHSDHLYEIYNHSIELTDRSLLQLVSQNVNKKFSAEVTNSHVITQSGFSKEDMITIQGELHYKDHLLYYQPNLWEEFKWAWIQGRCARNGSILRIVGVKAFLLARSSITDYVNPSKHSSVSQQGVLLCSMRVETALYHGEQRFEEERGDARIMSTRSKEKVVAAFRKLFRSSEKLAEQEGGNDGTTNSPSRRLLGRHHHHRPDAVTPSDGSMPENPGTSHTAHGSCFFKTKKSSSSSQGNMGIPEKGVRLRRLMKELSEIQKTQHRRDATFTAELVNDNLFEWHVRLHKIDPESELAADMRELEISYILLHVVFPENFPFAPPFMRVISPRIEKGFVMEGGAICMELLTPRGWASAYTIEAVITQFAASIVKGQGRVARKPKTNKEFNRRSAEESFRNLVKTHEKYGWVTPPLAEG